MTVVVSGQGDQEEMVAYRVLVKPEPCDFFFLPNLSVPINKQRVPQSSPLTPNRELWWAVGTLPARSNV